jgi:2-dehydro-3-deoxyphosphogluconate aldolase / (4S)-4-hydroxy-2-oxoglutarate aldolase
MMQLLLSKKLVPVATVAEEAEGLPLTEALLAGGLDLIELTFRVAGAAEVIRAIRTRYPEMKVGAGTILTSAQLRAAHDAGATFAVSPGLDEELVELAGELGLPFFPGVVTPSEIQRGIRLGCRILKFFPAGAVGGAKVLKAYHPVFAHTGVQFLPTGGIHAANMPDYLAIPSVCAVGGSWMVKSDLIAAGDWAAITALTRAALASCDGG